MASQAAPLLITPSDLADKLKSPAGISILDATWFMPNAPRNAREEFMNSRIHHSQFLDLDGVASPHELGLKHMMPNSQTFAKACVEKLGISRDTRVVIYDSHGVFSSPRALFMFRAFGHINSSVLDGGLPRWVDEGYSATSGSLATPKFGQYDAPQLDADTIRSYEQMVSNSQLEGDAYEILLDARAKGRFTGIDAEPRPGLSSGHIPGSYSLPFNLFLRRQSNKKGDLEYTTFLSPSEIREALNTAVGTTKAQDIVDGRKPVITSCGSGMTAAVLWLGLQLLGVRKVGLYDESWTGYAMRSGSKIEKST
ncbi:Rhodanese-like domain-containing protein [Crepidotus variabilis]|uniref:Rhodanese-like domain-containing protein n=1 Tax=Crepidotus variabilis TaxID=179855 RepID=A0A9P6JWF0_9AGAR|nr:Rhodanese-like domain-containing protein [Crepidotus variabilis]